MKLWNISSQARSCNMESILWSSTQYWIRNKIQACGVRTLRIFENVSQHILHSVFGVGVRMNVRWTATRWKTARETLGSNSEVTRTSRVWAVNRKSHRYSVSEAGIPSVYSLPPQSVCDSHYYSNPFHRWGHGGKEICGMRQSLDSACPACLPEVSLHGQNDPEHRARGICSLRAVAEMPWEGVARITKRCFGNTSFPWLLCQDELGLGRIC